MTQQLVIWLTSCLMEFKAFTSAWFVLLALTHTCALTSRLKLIRTRYLLTLTSNIIYYLLLSTNTKYLNAQNGTKLSLCKLFKRFNAVERGLPSAPRTLLFIENT